MRVGILEAGQELTARPREFAPKAYAKRQAGRGLLVKLTASLYRRVSPEEARLSRSEHSIPPELPPSEIFGVYFQEPERLEGS